MITFRTAGGRRIDLEHPTPGDITITDIARGLSNCCRFAGQLPRFYSVAQHSILVSHLVEPRLKLAALFHDASEAYLGDLSRNLKHHELLRGYRVLEERLQCAIEDHFQVGAVAFDYDAVKTADNLAALFEHVTMREQREFQPTHDIARLLDEGFIHGESWEDLVNLASRLPQRTTEDPPCGWQETLTAKPVDWFDPWVPWAPERAEERFLRYYGELTEDGA